MTDQTYNGWTNYETWNVKLWIDNDQGTQEYWLDRAVCCVGADGDDAAHTLARELESNWDECNPFTEQGIANAYADLLGHALSRVDWFEIARSLIEDAQELGE